LTNRITPFWSIPTKASGTASSRLSNLVVFEDIWFPLGLSLRTRNRAEARDLDKRFYAGTSPEGGECLPPFWSEADRPNEEPSPRPSGNTNACEPPPEDRTFGPDPVTRVVLC
jgi:hypothetical protein